jgi:lipoyl(octanoyl) transferase
MSSQVSRRSAIDISGPGRSSPSFLDFARNDKNKEATRYVFTALIIYHDHAGHSAAMNMAIDEALLEYAIDPVIRFYAWRSPALSFGYFRRFADVASYAGERDLIRRWTGGGIVFHGTDLTYSIVIPVRDAVFAESSMSIYEKIHRALCDVLVEAGHAALLGTETGVNNPGYNCFANPVRADVIVDGGKIAGAAQRRTRRGLLQQGSIQGVDISKGLAQRFAQTLSANCSERKVDDEILNRARELAEWKYGAEAWLHKR